MAYGKIYTSDFDSFKAVGYTLEFWKKDYSGAVTAVIASGIPVVHKWGPDDPKPPIKGSSLEIKLLNYQGSFPLSNFFSNEDDTFQVKFYRGVNLLFFGYLVQDDCNEVQDDFTHELPLSANDNIGLLKDVPLNLAPKAFAQIFTGAVTIITTAPHTIEVTGAFWLLVNTGDLITISGTGVDGTYTVADKSVSTFPTQFFITVVESIGAQGSISATLVLERADLLGRFSLAEIIKIAVSGTNLELNTKVYSQIIPSGKTRWLEDTYLDINTFFNGNEWQDCYTVLETIMKRFNATFCQGKGIWNIVRWFELKYGDIAGYEYDADMVYVQDVTLTDLSTIGSGTDIEAGLTASILRPYKFVKETFWYNQPGNLLRNANFSKLGPLIQSYPSGSNTVYEYEMADWEVGYDWNPSGTTYTPADATITRFIRVTKDSFDYEIDRYGVVRSNSTFRLITSAQAYEIEIRAGDRVRLSFDFKTSDSHPGPFVSQFIVNLLTTANPVPRSANNKYLNAQGQWIDYGAYGTGVPGVPGNVALWYLYHSTAQGSDSNQWQSVSVESEEAPVDGLLLVKLAQLAWAVPGETHYKNINFEISYSVNGQKAIGQTHTDTQPPVINNNSEEEILIDDSPRNSISGSLFLDTFTGPLQDLTLNWRLPGYSIRRLGQFTTEEELAWRIIQRTKLEGNALTSAVSVLSRIKYTPLPILNFIFGILSIDYKNDSASGTLWEMFEAVLVPVLTELLDTSASVSSTAPNTLTYSTGLFTTLVGDVIIIADTAIAGTYTVTAVAIVGANYNLTTAEPIITMGATVADISVFRYIYADTINDNYIFNYLYEKR